MGVLEGWGGAGVAEYLKVKQSREQDLPSMGCIVQQVLSLDDVDDLSQQQVLGRVSQPRVEDPVRLESESDITGYQKGSRRSLRHTSPRLRGERSTQRAAAKGWEDNTWSHQILSITAIL